MKKKRKKKCSEYVVTKNDLLRIKLLTKQFDKSPALTLDDYVRMEFIVDDK